MATVSISLSTLLQLTHTSAGYQRATITTGLLLGQTDAVSNTIRLSAALPMPAHHDIKRRAHHGLATRPTLKLIGTYALDNAQWLEAADCRLQMRVDSKLFCPPIATANPPAIPTHAESIPRTKDVLLEICSAANTPEVLPEILSFLSFHLPGHPEPLPNASVSIEHDLPAVLVLQSLFGLRTSNDVSACPLGRPVKTSLVGSTVLEKLAALHVPSRRTRVLRALAELTEEERRAKIAAREESIEQAEAGRELALAMGDLRELTELVSRKR